MKILNEIIVQVKVYLCHILLNDMGVQIYSGYVNDEQDEQFVK
jgi:hypothetical protein